MYDINNRGETIGTYDGMRGFLYRDGAFISLDMDSALIVSPRAINDLGMFAGFYKVRTRCWWENHGFLLEGGETTILDSPSFRPAFRGLQRRRLSFTQSRSHCAV